MKRNNIFALSIFSLFLFIGLTGCEDNPTPTTTEYTVTFDAGTGGTLTGPETVKVKEGEKVAEPTDPTRDGFTFVNWQKADGTTFAFTTETITADITLTAQWGFTVTFDANEGMLADGTTRSTVQVVAGAKVTKPTDPTRTDYNFIAWQKNSNSPPFEFDTETITADITLTAQWVLATTTTFTVTFDGEGVTIQSQTVPDGDMAKEPNTPTRDGFTFVKWQTDNGSPFSFNTAITADITLTAQWAQNFTVTFAGENITISPQTVPDGGMADEPPTPTRDGFTFTGWQDDNGSPFSFNTAITADITLTAQWVGASTPTFTVTFAGEDVNIQSQNVEDGGMATPPPTPTRDGFTFFNWYEDAMFNELYDFSTAVTSDITVYARWLSNTKYTVTFKPDQGTLAGGNDNNTIQISEGEKLPQPIDPTRDGSSFVEWQKAGGTAFDFDTETITAPITLTATWADAVGSLADVAIVLNDANTAYEVNYKYTNAAGGTTGGTPEITWFLSDKADGTAPTKVSMEATYTLEDKNRYNKYLVASVRVMAAAGGFTPTVTVVRSPGFSTEATRGATSTRFSVRNSHTSVLFKGKIWLIGGRNVGSVEEDVWSSADGITWAQEPGRSEQNPRFSARSGHTSVVFKDAIWVIGGANALGRENDVWSSEDGSNWVKKADETEQNPRFSGRSGLTSVVFKNAIWVIGGYLGYDEGYQNDVWSSEDGSNWVKKADETEQNPRFSARSNHTSVVFNGKMWVIGGADGGYRNDVWSSEDGATWTQVTADAQFSERFGHTSVVFDGKMWVIGGADGTNYFNDVWSSEDGINWIEYQEVPEKSRFSGRRQHTSVVLDDKKIWVIGGTDGSGKNDVWY